MISAHREVSSCSRKFIRDDNSFHLSGEFFLTNSSELSVYCSVHVAMVLVYQLLLTLFSYSFGPVTPSITYLFLSDDQVMRCDQKRDIPINTSRPYSLR